MAFDANVRLRPTKVADAAFIVEMARHACVIEDWPLPEADSEDTESLLPGKSNDQFLWMTLGEVTRKGAPSRG